MSKWALLKSIVAVAFLSLTASARAAETVVVYTGINEEAFTTVIKAEFTRQTGIAVEMLVIPANGTLIARVETEKNRPRADVIVDTTADFIQKLKGEGLLDAYKAKAETPEFVQRGYADADGFMHGWFAITPVIFWNKERFGSDPSLKGVQQPTSWDELLNPALKGKLIIPNPQTTAMGAVTYLTQIFRLGEDKAWDYTRKLNDNVSQYTASAALPVALVERGEGTVGIGWSADVLGATIGRGQQLGFAIPEDDAISVWAAAIIKGGPNPDAARKFVDFLQGDFVQNVTAKLGYRLPLSPTATAVDGVPPLTSVKAVNYDLAWAAQNMDRVRKRWARETGN